MLTRNKAVIVITGDKACRDEVFKILTNHEALVRIKSSEQIEQVWKNNKTPLVDHDDFTAVCSDFAGFMLVFNVDQLKSTSQEFVSDAFTRYCYKRKIEPGEFRVLNTANNSSDGCLFCGFINHPDCASTFEYNLKAKFVDMFLYESSNFVVIFGLGPLAEAYLMIMPKKHYLSIAQLPDYLMKEYLEVETDMKELLTTMYHKPIGFFEHGTGPNGAVGLKSLVHAHVHIMLDNILKDEYKQMLSMKKISDITIAKSESYFWYKDGTTGEQYIVFDPDVYIPRQVHRQIYAEEHNFATDQFNWRKTSFEEITKRNVWQICDFLSKNRNLVSERIWERCSDFVRAGQIRFEQ